MSWQGAPEAIGTRVSCANLMHVPGKPSGQRESRSVEAEGCGEWAASICGRLPPSRRGAFEGGAPRGDADLVFGRRSGGQPCRGVSGTLQKLFAARRARGSYRASALSLLARTTRPPRLGRFKLTSARNPLFAP